MPINTIIRRLTDLLDLASARIDAAERSPGDTAALTIGGGAVVAVLAVVLDTPGPVAWACVGGAAVNAVWAVTRVARESRLTISIGRMVRLEAGRRLLRLERLKPSPATDGRKPEGQGRPGREATDVAVRRAA